MTRIIVGADGAGSTVARDAGLMRGVSLGMGMEAETSVAGEKLVQWDSLMGLDLGHIRGGYGWVFPKKDHLSIGVGRSAPSGKKAQVRIPCRAEIMRPGNRFGVEAEKSLTAGAQEGHGNSVSGACCSGMRPGWWIR